MPRRITAGLAKKVMEGDVRAAARLISRIENGSPEAFAELDRLYPAGGKAYVVGVTGPPGVGKSTLVDGLIASFRKQDSAVGVIAIDPSSAVTGGALLGDRVRMQRHSADPRVFIRSLATRGWAGGLARAAIGTIRVMDALGRDFIIVETVGSGQIEVDIARAADTTVLVMAPDAGDEVQTMKAGILETADIIVINKADRDGADRLRTDIESMLAMSPRSPSEWRPPVIPAEAIHEEGIDELAGAIIRHRESLLAGGGLARRRRERARLELLEAVEGFVRDGVAGLEGGGHLDEVLDRLLEGKTTPRRAGLEILDRLSAGLDRLIEKGGDDGP
jgi:LAO/AO transport system kinase